MSLEIPLLPLLLLGLVFAAALILSLRPPEGFRIWLGSLFKSKSQAEQNQQYYDAFGIRQRQPVPAQYQARRRRDARGWMRGNQ